ncbi:hypothetical protein WK78_03015 [Burkholderia cepacia]|uniref:hypothetical protein n=1 Tax=Burkholderia cepacia TaxID=292 RepID=UPI00075D5297|nr:hypothetical protein [Burkholderia cepacia]KVV25079.1 hypothetical protein WK78_03015 [Burkholderia cepacia]
MDEKTQRVIEQSSSAFLSYNTYAAIALLAGLLLGWVLGRALSGATSSKAAGAVVRRICPFVGLLAAAPLAYKLFMMG